MKNAQSAVPQEPEQQINPFANAPVVAKQSGTIAEAAVQREVAEVQAAMVIAKRFPRDQIVAMDKILQACTRPSLAESALYQYSRGGSDITGPSIRLAEVMAQGWGNVLCGVTELGRHEGRSECLSYAWDLETNFRDDKRFSVRHWRDTKKGGYAITDERDVYELIANMGARRKRACILTVIPGDVVEAAIRQCEVTMKTKIQITPDFITGLIATFATHGVTKEHIEKRIQRRIDSITPALAAQLKKIHNSLKDGMSTPADWFEVAASEPIVEGPKSKSKPVDKETGEITEGDKAEGAKPESGKPLVEFEKLKATMESRTDVATLEADATLIGEIPDIDKQNKLAKLYQSLRAALVANKL